MHPGMSQAYYPKAAVVTFLESLVSCFVSDNCVWTVVMFKGSPTVSQLESRC